MVRMDRAICCMETALAGLDVVDIGDADEAAASPTIAALGERPLRIDAGAPWSMTLLRGQRANFIVFVCHSALLDRFSLQSLFAALSQAYAGRDAPRPRLGLGLDQYALLEVERASLEPEQWRRDLAFWMRELGDGAFA